LISPHIDANDIAPYSPPLNSRRLFYASESRTFTRENSRGQKDTVLSPARRNAARFALVTFILATAATVVLVATRSTVVADEWLPVPPADLAMKDNPAEPGADAMILYRSSHVDARRASIDGEYDLEYIRIKIFTQKGADEESTPEIDFVHGDSDIVDIAARTIKPDGTVVNFDGKVYEKVLEKSGNSNFLGKTFTPPQVEPGCIIEYRYRRTYKPDFVFEQDWTVSQHLFMRDAYFSIDPYAARSSMDPTLYFRTTNLPAGTLPLRQGNGSYKMEVHNLPGIADESLMPPLRALEARVDFFYRDAGEPSGLSAPQFWNAIGKQRGGDVDKFLNKKSALAQAVSETVAASDTPEQKLQKLYNRAQKVRNLSFQDEKSAAELKAEAIKPNNNVEELLKHDYATGYQINILLVGLARAAGFDADMVYIAARDRSIFTPNGQAVNQLDDNLVWVRAGDKEYWLDPASKYFPFGLLPWNETESNGIRLSKNGADFVTTPAQKSSDATAIRNVELQLADDGSAAGTFDISFTGAEGAIQRESIYNDDEAGRKVALERELKRDLPQGANISVDQISNWDDTSKPLEFNGKIKLATFGSVTGRRLLVPITVFLMSHRAAFHPEKRSNAIRFGQRYEQMDTVSMTAPANYTIGVLPESKKIVAGNSFRYIVESTQHGQTLQITRHLAINDISFPRDEYASVRHFMLAVQTNDEAQAVFTTSADAKPATATAASPAKN